MKYALIADIHGNMEALQVVLDNISQLELRRLE